MNKPVIPPLTCRFGSMLGAILVGLLLAPAAVLGAPAAPHVVIAAPTDDGVFLEGYNLTSGGADVSVDVVRGGVVIATGGPFTPTAPPVPGDPTAIEINHLGEPTCWSDRTPDLVWGDTIRVTQAGVVEESQVRNLTVGDPVEVDATTVELHGVATEADGLTRLPIAELGGRLINPAFQGFFGGGPFINIPDVRVGATVTATATIAFDEPANLANPAWTATVVFSGAAAEAAADAALAAEPEIGWIGATEVAEAGVQTPTSGGPADPCTAPSGAFAVVQATPATLDVASTDLTVTGTTRTGTTSAQISVDDANPATPPVVSPTETPVPHGGGMIWTITLDAGLLDTLDNGTLTITPVVTPTPAVPVLVGSVTKARGPGVLVSSGPANGQPTNQPSATFVFSATQPLATFTCSLDGAAYTPCASPHTAAALADGPHSLAIRATVGTQTGSPTTRTWSVDTVAPTTNIVSGPAVVTNRQTATFVVSNNEAGVTLRCAADGATPAPCTSPATLSGLGDGAHTFVVTASDAAGNTGAPAAYAWVVDLVKPVLTVKIPGVRNLATARTGVLRLTGRCNERCTLVARARVVVPNRNGAGATIIRLTTIPVDANAGATTNVRLRLNAVQLRRVRQALRANRNVRIHVTVVATDRAGNATVALPGVTLRPNML